MDDRQSWSGAEDSFPRDLMLARKAREWTIRDLAAALGVSPAFVSLVEAGKKLPGEETAVRWAGLVGINPRIFLAWVRSRQRRDVGRALQGRAEYQYLQSNPNVQIRVADARQIAFEPAAMRESTGKSAGQRGPAIRVPLIPEGKDPDSDVEPMDCVTIDAELLGSERLVRPFAYRLSSQGARRVLRTLHPGDYAVISRETGAIERVAIYAVRVKNRIILSHLLQKSPSLLLLLSDAGEAGIDAVSAQDGKARSLIVGRVVAAIRPWQYTIVSPGRPDES